VTNVGVVTIGQSPRRQLADELQALLPTDALIVQSGALDEVSDEDLAVLRPRSAAATLTTVLRGGRAVQVDRDGLVALVEAAISRVESAGAEVTVFVCTGSFPPLAHHAPLLHAEQLLFSGVAGLSADVSRVGIVVPLPDQEREVVANWRRVLSAEVYVSSADPYSAAALPAVTSAARGLAEQGAGLLVLDCMGYGAAARKAAATSGIPIVLARSVVARLAAEFVAGLSRTG
jgi:protein AroM